MMPIDFCASLDPWANAMNPADTSCRLRNPRFTAVGRIRRTIQSSTIIRANPPSRPNSGDSTSASSARVTPRDDNRPHSASPAGFDSSTITSASRAAVLPILHHHGPDHVHGVLALVYPAFEVEQHVLLADQLPRVGPVRE